MAAEAIPPFSGAREETLYVCGQTPPLITFFVLTYAISWVGLPLYAAGVWPIPFLATGPLIAALIVIPLTQGRAGLRELGSRMIRWQVGWIWWALAIGLPLGVHLVTAGLNVAAGAGVPSLAFGSVTTFLLMFAVRMVNPLDGPLGEEPGWRGFALPGLQSTLSPLVSTLILAVLITGWHLPLFFLEEGGLQPSFIVTALLSTVAVTFWYNWLFNRTGGSVLMTLVAHNIEGDFQAQGWIYMGVWLAVAIGLVVFDWQFWRGPAPAPATFQPAYGGERRVR
jgi:membrane protease YdiL (CAAX protease family)